MQWLVATAVRHIVASVYACAFDRRQAGNQESSMHSTPAYLSTKATPRSLSGLRCLSLAVALIAAVWAGANSIAGAAPSEMAHSVVATDISGLNLGRPIGLLAQAGSTGGSVGQTDKSISGEPPAQAPPPAAKPSNPPPAAKPSNPPPAARTKSQPAQAATGNGCRSIVGTWSSWASGMFGANDTRFNADGTITHPSSAGTWSCENGLYNHVWARFGQRGPYKLSADGKQLIKVQDGSVSFYRGGAAPSAPARN
jgi:hypothetical protein